MRASILTLKRARVFRRKMTLPEVLLWQELRRGKLNGFALHLTRLSRRRNSKQAGGN